MLYTVPHLKYILSTFTFFFLFARLMATYFGGLEYLACLVIVNMISVSQEIFHVFFMTRYNMFSFN